MSRSTLSPARFWEMALPTTPRSMVAPLGLKVPEVVRAFGILPGCADSSLGFSRATVRTARFGQIYSIGDSEPEYEPAIQVSILDNLSGSDRLGSRGGMLRF